MDVNPFEILQLKPSPKMDLGEMRKRYIEIQRNGHPDLGNDSGISELANKAYSLLKSDESRMAEIIKFYGVWPPDTKLIGMDFLMETMEISEAIDAVLNSTNPDITEVQGSLTQLRKELDNQLDSLQFRVQENSNWTTDTDLLNDISTWYQKCRYLTRLEKNLKGEEEL